MTQSDHTDKAFELAKEQYAASGVNVDDALKRMREVSLSIHCWQGDDVSGFEGGEDALGNGLAVTGDYPGRARTPAELRQDLELAYSLIPGKHRLNLHALYGEFDGPVDRDEIGVEHFQGWIDWSRQVNVDLDFNPSYFSHANAADGFTLAHADSGIRQFWIDHGIACRRISAAMGQAQGSPSIDNFWVPDGYKDTPADRKAPRERLLASLDEIFAEQLSSDHTRDAVECKLFGIGSESYVVGSHEFYLGYAISRQMMLCLDAG
ncbi:MAG: L-rhamnose isomerase, partial [Planctomycetota bacterium]